MGKPLHLNILIVCVVFGQGILVSSEENLDTSPLLTRQKRASSSSGMNSLDSSPEHPSHGGGSESSLIGRKRKYSPGTKNTIPYPTITEDTPDWIPIMHRGKQVGTGVVVHEHIMAAKASSFVTGQQYYIEIPGPSGNVERHAITKVTPSKEYVIQNEGLGGKNDVAFADTNASLPKNDRLILYRLRVFGKFTPHQVTWVGQRIG